MTSAEINEINAFEYSDNYSLLSSDGLNCYGTEHNQQEADVLARYLSNYHGRKIIVRKNSIDAVRAAQKLRKPFRYEQREFAFKKMGFWK